MTFWLIAVVMTAAVLVLLMPAFFGRVRRHETDRDDQNVLIARQRLAELEADAARGVWSEDELARERAALEEALAQDLAPAETPPSVRSAAESAWAVALAVAIPVAASGLYLFLGEPRALLAPPPGAPAAAHPQAAGQGDTPSVETMIGRLESRLQVQPDDAEGWFMLARSYMMLERYSDAVTAFERLHGLVGDDANVLVRYADAVAMANGGRLAGRATALLARALELDPDQPQGLWLAGMAAAERNDHRGALGYWRRLEPLLSEQPESAAELRTLMARSQQRLDDSPAAQDPAEAGERAADAAASLKVAVALDENLAARVSPEDAVYIFARAVDGPPIPLAVVRRRVRNLPLVVTLDDSSAMAPGMTLSRFPTVRVGARISRSGNPMAQSGDLQGEVAPVVLAEVSRVELTITDVIP